MRGNFESRKVRGNFEYIFILNIIFIREIFIREF